jgi:general secretion pathway protein G
MQHEEIRGRRRKSAGFTLIELLVAIAILGILGTVVIGEIWDHVDESRQVGTKAKLESIETQVRLYLRKNHTLPRELSELIEFDPRNNNKPYLQEENLYDAWDHPIVLLEGERPGEFEVVSYGRNGEQDGFEREYGLDMDISSHRPLDDPNQR